MHGLAEHMGRYVHVADALTAAGFRATGLELRGHGHSGGKRGHVDSWEQYVDDVRAAARSIGGPHAILCHSMGGLVTLDHLRDGEAWAVFASAPLLGVGVEAPAWKLAAARTLSRWLPRLSMANEIDSRLICSDPAVVAAYDVDPLVYGTITPRWFTEALATMARVHAMAESGTIPLHVAYGTGDRIVNTAAIERFVAAYGGPCELRRWEGLYHEILNEPAQADILAQAVAFFARHVPGA